MNVVNTGSRFQIYGEDVKTYRHLPVGSYDVDFNPFTGFSLRSRNDLAVKEEKIYGSHERKANKVIDAFNLSDRNFGIILSGKKGIGKSLFARVLAEKGIAQGIPMITINSYYDGLSNFLGSIEQEVIVLFDEFEKNFKGNQESLLSLFDGIDCGKKLFVITCNKPTDLNEYLLNRTGRFHYHFMMEPPTAEEIKEYMTDKLLPEFYSLIDEIVTFAVITDLPYDCLRAIAFEINRGYSLQETLDDLNITKVRPPRYNIAIRLSDGTVLATNYPLDIYCKKEVAFEINYNTEKKRYSDAFIIKFIPSKIGYDFNNRTMILDKKFVKLIVNDDILRDCYEVEEEEILRLNSLTISDISIEEVAGDTIKYVL